MTRKRFHHNTIAVIYDFDGTLTPQPMQEYTVLPKLGIEAKEFWSRVDREAKEQNADGIATYMRLMIEQADVKKFKITRKDLGSLSKNIKYFPGVEDFFEKTRQYTEEKSENKVKIRHYVISSGLKEIIEKTPLARHFHNIFASEYYYDIYNKAAFPNVIVNDTLKTQFLFRINKGKERLSESINTHTPFEDRAIPFENIIYIGDGLTDVPCMTVTNKEGGFAIAVYKAHSPEGLKTCKELFQADRIDYLAKADYSEGSDLYKIVISIIDQMIANIVLLKESYSQYKKYGD
jgi:hypothetical protein